MAQNLTLARTAPTIPALDTGRRTGRQGTAYTEQLLAAQIEAAWAAAELDASRVDRDDIRQAQAEAAWAQAHAKAIGTRAQERETDLADELAELRQRILDTEAELKLTVLGLRGVLPAIETGLDIAELAA
jgi:hypothetical protein